MGLKTKTSKNLKKGISGHGIFIKEKIGEMVLTNNPYTGDSASEDFADDWKSLSEEK